MLTKEIRRDWQIKRREGEPRHGTVVHGQRGLVDKKSSSAVFFLERGEARNGFKSFVDLSFICNFSDWNNDNAKMLYNTIYVHVTTEGYSISYEL